MSNRLGVIMVVVTLFMSWCNFILCFPSSPHLKKVFSTRRGFGTGWLCSCVHTQATKNLGSFPSLKIIPIPGTHLGIAAGDEQQGQEISHQQDGNLVHLLGCGAVCPVLPAERAVGSLLMATHEGLVLGHGDGNEERQQPDDSHAEDGVALAADAGRAFGMDHGNVSVHRHGHQSEDADQHRCHGRVVNPLAKEGTEDPLWQGVDGGLEGNTEEQKGEVCNA